MNTRNIGPLKVSAVGLGCNNFGWGLDEAASGRVIRAALDAGITFFDTADIYGETLSEEYLGRALGKRRSEVIVASKFGMKLPEGTMGASKAHVRNAIQGSLRRLGTDYIDLYQLHKPDETVDIAETLEVLNELVAEGSVRHIGCSNFSVAQLKEAAKVVGAKKYTPFLSVQNEYSLMHRDPEQEILPYCAATELAFLPYFPLASGLLTGKFRRGQAIPENTRVGGGGRLDFTHLLTDERLDTVEELISFAEAREHTLLELSFAWLLSHVPVSSVIAGATKPEQISANARAADWILSDQEIAEIDRLTERYVPSLSR